MTPAEVLSLIKEKQVKFFSLAENTHPFVARAPELAGRGPPGQRIHDYSELFIVVFHRCRK